MTRIALALSALALAACSSAPAPVSAQAMGPQVHHDPPRQIHVNANASVNRVPDRAVIQLAVESIAPTAREATDQNSRTMEQVLAALRQIGIPNDQIQTLRIELHPQYDNRRQRDPSTAPEIVGYRALNQVIVDVDAIDRVGAVVDAAVNAGANRVTGINFELSEPEEAYYEALRIAVEKAQTEARVVAEAMGETLGPPISVSTGGFHVPRPYMRAMGGDMIEATAAAPPPPVEPGEMEINASVSITYRLGT